MILQPAQSVNALRPHLGKTWEQSQVTCVADVGAREIANVTYATGALSAQGEFILVTNVAGTTWAVWIDIDAAGTAPNGAIYTASDNQIEVDISSGDTAAQVATKVFTAIGANITNVTCTNPSAGVVRLAQDKIGAVANVVAYAEDEVSSSSATVAIATAGANSNLQNTYFQLKNGAGSDFFVWCDVGSEGVEPAGTGTAIPASVEPSDTAASVALAVATAINANGNFSSEVTYSGSSSLTLVNDDSAANVTDIVDVDTTFTFSVLQQGQALIYSPATITGSISVTPSLIS